MVKIPRGGLRGRNLRVHHYPMRASTVSESPPPASHGVMLTRFLEKEWDALYTTRGAWCRKVGLADSTLLRWGTGVEPDMKNMQKVAEGLNRKLIDILYAAGYLPEEQFRARTVVGPSEKVDLVEMIRNDASLNNAQRQALLAVHAAFQDDGAAGKRSVRVTRKG